MAHLPWLTGPTAQECRAAQVLENPEGPALLGPQDMASMVQGTGLSQPRGLFPILFPNFKVYTETQVQGSRLYPAHPGACLEVIWAGV